MSDEKPPPKLRSIQGGGMPPTPSPPDPADVFDDPDEPVPPMRTGVLVRIRLQVLRVREGEPLQVVGSYEPTLAALSEALADQGVSVETHVELERLRSADEALSRLLAAIEEAEATEGELEFPEGIAAAIEAARE